MRLIDYNYTIPKGLVAKSPSETNARMLVVNCDPIKGLEFTHTNVSQLPKFLRDYNVVYNDADCRKSYLQGLNDKNRIKQEVVLTSRVSKDTFTVITEPSSRDREGQDIFFSNGKDFLIGKLGKSTEMRGRLMTFRTSGDLDSTMDRVAEYVIPNYVQGQFDHLPIFSWSHPHLTNKGLFKNPVGAEPHTLLISDGHINLNKKLIKKMDAVSITVKSGLDWHRDPKVQIVQGIDYVPNDDIKLKKDRKTGVEQMETEVYSISKETARSVTATGRNCAVGVEVYRALEMATHSGVTLAGESATNTLLSHPFRPKTVNALLTQFAAPCSKQLIAQQTMLGIQNLHAVYKEAKKEKYQFLHYGDSLLILNRHITTDLVNNKSYQWIK